MHWQEKWADIALHGYRPGGRAEDVWMDLSLSVESALVAGSDLVGMSIDWIGVNVLVGCHRESPSCSLRERRSTPSRAATAARHVPRAAKKVCRGGSRGEGICCL